MICIPDSLSRNYRGKSVHNNAFLYQANLNDSERALFVSENEEETVILIQNGVALSLLYNSLQWNLDLTKSLGDRPNLFVKWKVRYIENLDITDFRGKDQNVRYIGNTIVPMSLKNNKLLTERLLSPYYIDSRIC